MSRYRRWNDLLELLATAGQLQIEEAAAALNVSAATIRRDFDELASQQMLTRIRGGAVAQAVNYDLPLRYKSERHPSEKQRIGQLAALPWGSIALRNAEHPGGPVLVYTYAEIEAFIAGVKDGEFDDLIR